MRRTLGLAMAVALGFVAVARAEPLELKQISADAKWAAHLDVDALHASTMFQKAREQLLQKHPDAKEHLEMIRSVWKFDPCTDLHGVTFYGTQIKKDTGVAIVHAKVDQQLLLDKAKQAPEHQASTHGKYELHTWKHKHPRGPEHGRMLTGVFYKPDVIVFGSLDEVKAALDVLDGTKPNFSGKESGLTISIPAGAVFVAGAVGLADANLPCKSPLAKQADSLVLAIGENQGEVFLSGNLVVKRADVAQQIKTVVDGALALGQLVHGDDAGAVNIIKAVKVTAADKAVDVEWRAPVDAAWTQIQKAIARAKEARKNWREHGMPGGCPLEKK